MASRMQQDSNSRYRRMVFSRVMAAVLGGYALSSAFIILLAELIPGTLADAVLTATLFSFAIYTAAIIWVFSVRTATLAWGGMLFVTALCYGAAQLLKMLGGAA